jgi:alkylation response protein AidB-like acyl-CoA dehydrogenase
MEVALEAVQLFGGNGYMAEFQVEQLARDAKVLQIYGGPTRSRSRRSPAHCSRPSPFTRGMRGRL